MARTSILDVRDVSKAFPVDYSIGAWLRNGARRPRTDVLHGIDLAVERGELFGLLGPNGAGKTTVLKMLATLLIPDAGSIRIDGIDAIAEPMRAKRRIGLSTSEERSFYGRLTARANLEFFAGLAGLDRRTTAARIEQLAAFVDLHGDLRLPVQRYSTGMRQRLTLARALLADPNILFLDEPTRAVDPVHADELRTMIRDQLCRAEGKTVVLATNLLEEAWAICDRVAVISEGRIVALGAPRDLHVVIGDVRTYVLRISRLNDDLLDAIRGATAVRRIDVTPCDGAVDVRVEVASSPSALTALIGVLSRSGVVLHAFREIEHEPMDTFRQLIGVDDGR